MNFEIECEREEDGRWLAEVPQLPGVLAYGDFPNEAMAKAQILALRVLAERLETVRPYPRPSPLALLRDRVALDQGAPRLRGVASRRVAIQAPVRITPRHRARMYV